MSASRKVFPTLLLFILGGAFFGGTTGMIIISSGTGHVPWQAVLAVPLVAGLILAAVLGAMYLTTQNKQKTQR